MVGQAVLTVGDYSHELSTTRMNVPDLTGANLDAQITKLNTLITALDGIIGGAIRKGTLTSVPHENANWPDADPTAQREMKWVVIAEDSVPRQYKYEFACPTMSAGTLNPGSDRADFTDAAVAAFIAAFNDFAKSPTGDDLTIVDIYLKGRNT